MGAAQTDRQFNLTAGQQITGPDPDDDDDDDGGGAGKTYSTRVRRIIYESGCPRNTPPWRNMSGCTSEMIVSSIMSGVELVTRRDRETERDIGMTPCCQAAEIGKGR